VLSNALQCVRSPRPFPVVLALIQEELLVAELLMNERTGFGLLLGMRCFLLLVVCENCDAKDDVWPNYTDKLRSGP
jgi:hypothetical protein